MSYPRFAAERTAVREMCRAREVAEGERRGAMVGRSIRCQEGDHRTQEWGGCANDGSNCICVCHDAPDPKDGT